MKERHMKSTISGNICYLCSNGAGMELVLCENSTISYPLHNHISVFTIGIILEGSILLTTERGEESYGKNKCFVIHPYKPHSISACGHYTMLSICIDKNRIKKSSFDTIKSNLIKLLADVPDNIQQCRITQYQLEKLLQQLEFLSKEALTNRKCCFWIQLLREQLEQHPEKRYSIDEMAQAAFLSKYHFIRKFREEVGLTPHQFQIQNRIRKAKHLLCRKRAMTQTALDAGFCDQSHFIRQFEKYVGLTPSDYESSVRIIEM